MTRKLLLLTVLCLAFVALVVAPAFAANRVVNKMDQYRFLYKKQMVMHGAEDYPISRQTSFPTSLGVTAGNSPGAQVGFTYYDYQQNSTMGRQIDWRGSPQINFAWMFGPVPDVEGSRTIAYNVYDPVAGNWPLGAGIGCPIVDQNQQRAGYINLDIRPPAPATDEVGSAVYGAHVAPGVGAASFRTQVFWDQATTTFGWCDWSATNRVSDSLNDAFTADDLTWPKIEYHIFGTDTVTYAVSYGGGGVDAIVLFRSVGQIGAGAWEGRYIDSCFFIVQDVCASRVSGKVAVAYNIPTATETAGGSERDVAYRESTDMGLTFAPRVNITNYDDNVAGWRSWLEVSCIYDTDDNLHIIWNASVYTPQGGAGGRDCRLFHWSDLNPTTISTVHNAEWDPALADCAMDVNTLNLAKINISQCDTNMYVIWSQANDPPNGITDDCGDPNIFPANLGGNAEIYLSVSSGLGGLSWDAARNLTNTYTPNCDTIPGSECDSDNWGSMSRYGMNNADFAPLNFSNAPAALTVDPSGGSYTGSYYLDIQYINDLAPGGATENTDILKQNAVRWFRLPCVDPVVQANANLSPSNISYPFYVQHGQDTVVAVTVENSGNSPMTASVNKAELNGPTGWLAIDVTSLSIPAAINNFDTVNVTLNNGGVVNNPGTTVNLQGVVWLAVDPPAVRDSVALNLDFLVVDTIVGLKFDTVATSCFSLVVSNNGNMGNAGAGGNGGANMNFFADCDDSDTIPGDALVYLYDGSPVIFTGDTVASWSIFGAGFASENSFRPIESDPAPGSFTGTDFDAYYSGKFVTVDSTLVVEKTWYAPTGGVDCDFIIQAMCITAFDGTAQSGLTIGEAWDWDLPSDTAVRNSAGSDPFTGTVWLQGGEWNDGALGDQYECQQNDDRFGGAAFIGYTDAANGTLNTSNPENFFTALNEDFVLPAGGFIPAELYTNMQTNNGFTAVPSTTIEDQHMVMTVFKNYSLAAGDTLVVYIAMAAVENGSSGDMTQAITDARAWFTAHPNLPKRPGGPTCCIGETGDVNADGNRTLTDLTQLVNYLFVTFVAPNCLPAANTNGDAACGITLTDLTRLVNKLFVTFVPCADCGSFDNGLCP